MLEWEGQQNGALYITGDTIYYHGIEEVAERFRIDIGIFHLGRASFPITGPVRFTMDARDGIKAARRLTCNCVRGSRGITYRRRNWPERVL